MKTRLTVKQTAAAPVAKQQKGRTDYNDIVLFLHGRRGRKASQSRSTRKARRTTQSRCQHHCIVVVVENNPVVCAVVGEKPTQRSEGGEKKVQTDGVG